MTFLSKDKQNVEKIWFFICFSNFKIYETTILKKNFTVQMYLTIDECGCVDGVHKKHMHQ